MEAAARSFMFDCDGNALEVDEDELEAGVQAEAS
jgi:hypothetical protein